MTGHRKIVMKANIQLDAPTILEACARSKSSNISLQMNQGIGAKSKQNPNPNRHRKIDPTGSNGYQWYKP
jgi:hypothetical protein